MVDQTGDLSRSFYCLSRECKNSITKDLILLQFKKKSISVVFKSNSKLFCKSNGSTSVCKRERERTLKA